MTASGASRRSIAGLALFSALIVALTVSLGVWQLQRRVAKHALIAALTERLAAVPIELPPPRDWAQLTPANDEFRRVSFAARYANVPDAMVYSSGSAIRRDVSGPGTWAFMPAQLAGGARVVVNAGFVPNTLQDRAQQDRATKPLLTGEAVRLTGYLRFPETGGALTAAADAGKRLWFARDVAEMAATLGWGEVAPFYIDLEAPVPASGVPKPGPLSVRLKDDHLQYAITWFGLAATVTIGFAVWLLGQRRRPRGSRRSASL
jgi:cytochrome oxidase assembly protein ShyY1